MQAIAGGHFQSECFAPNARSNENAASLLRLPGQRVENRDALAAKAIEIHELRAQEEDHMLRGHPKVMIGMREFEHMPAACQQIAGRVKFVDMQTGLDSGIRNAEIEQVTRRGVDFSVRRKRTQLVQPAVKIEFTAGLERDRIE